MKDGTVGTGNACDRLRVHTPLRLAERLCPGLWSSSRASREVDASLGSLWRSNWVDRATIGLRMTRPIELLRHDGPLCAGDDVAIARILSRAFHEDPVFAWVEPDPSRRRAFLEALYPGVAITLRSIGETHGARGPDGALLGIAAWVPPGRAPGLFDYLRSGLVALPFRCGPASTVRVLRALAALEAGFRAGLGAGPAWILDHLGVDPDAQGRGVGGLLLRRQLARLDADHAWALLNTTRESNVRLYERFGFETARVVRIGADAGFSLWTMRRAPRAAESS